MKKILLISALLLTGCEVEEIAIDTMEQDVTEEEIIYNIPNDFSCDNAESNDQSALLLESIIDKRIIMSDGKWVEVYSNGYIATSEAEPAEFCLNSLDIIIPSSKASYSFGTDNPKTQDLVTLLSREYDNDQLTIIKVRKSCLFESCENILINKIGFLGNSLTHHAPSPSIGWHGTWGMAATAKENDYVHQTVSMIGNGTKFGVYGIGGWEIRFEDFDYSIYQDLVSYNPDVIVINSGENVNGKVRDKDEIISHLIDMNNYFKENTDSTIVFIAPFWGGSLFKEAYYNFSTINQAKIVETNDLSFNIENTAVAEYAHRGVGIHPSDKGMKKIAERLMSHF